MCIGEKECLMAGGFDLVADPVAVVCQAKRVSERRRDKNNPPAK